MSRYISKKNRLRIKQRAVYCCEYCRVPELFSFIGYEIDHIIPIKHGGSSELSNLALSCAFCNNFKGTDVATYLLPSLNVIRFFHPRLDTWDDHFTISAATILPKTKIGEATIKILQLNHPNRIIERKELVSSGLFPPPNYPMIN